MARRFVNQLADQEGIDEIYLASNKQLRPNRNGDLYLQLDLCDRSGSISARLWNADDNLYHSFENGDFVRVRGTAQVFQGAMQIIASRVQREPNPEIDEADFYPLSPAQIDRFAARLAELLRSCGLSLADQRTLGDDTPTRPAWGGFATATVESRRPTSGLLRD